MSQQYAEVPKEPEYEAAPDNVSEGPLAGSVDDRIPSPPTPPHLRGFPSIPGISHDPMQPPAPNAVSDMRAYIAATQRQLESPDLFDPRHGGYKNSFKHPVEPQKKWWQRVPSWSSVLRFTALYMVLPFITGVMAGMGEIFANELMFRWGWRGARPLMVKNRGNRVFPVTDKPGADFNVD
ncbi:hypothetical protein EC988_008679 [Linderina pennispora]|nr:hypothetical protein EC988_008679 [Linderina pennispora]